MSFIDPTSDKLSGNTNYENLNIYVNFTAKRRGVTIINADVRESNNLSTKSVNLLGYKNTNNKLFTTDYTEIYRNESVYEGFGISKINIEMNSSYVPTVKVDFVDIKGMSFFNNNEESPYSILFDFPPPIFKLTIKGYYGYGLEYNLHLLRHNSRFDSETGNYYISAEFVGNTFAPLADILFQYPLTVSKMNKETNNVDDRTEVKNISELIAKSEKIKSEITSKLTNEVKDIQTTIDSYNKLNDIIRNPISLESGIEFIEIFNDRASNFVLQNNEKFTSITDEFKINFSTYNKNNIYLLLIRLKSSDQNITSTEISKLKTQYNQFPQEIRGNFNIKTNSNGEKVINGINVKISESPILFIEINDIYENLSTNINQIKDRYDNLVTRTNDQINKIVVSELGFVPTVKKVMEIICDDIDKWINELAKTYNESIGFFSDNTNRNRISNSFRNGVDKIYPFPDYIEVNKKTIPTNGILSNMPEIKLVDNFITSFIERKKENDRDEAIKTSQLNNQNGDLLWNPINPLDSTYFNKSNKNPYINATNHLEVIKTLIARYYIFRYYTLTSLKDNDNTDYDKYLYGNFFASELNNIRNTIESSTILEALKNINYDTNISEKQNLFNILKGDLIDFNLVNELLSNIEFNTVENNPENFNGIVFPSELNTLKIDNFSDFIDESYLFRNPKLTEDKKILYTSGSTYKIKKRASSEKGVTLNNENNIIFYDGRDNDSTMFTSFDSKDGIVENASAFLSKGKVEDVFRETILKSLKINSTQKGFELIDNKIIRGTKNIKKVIYNQYNGSNIYKRYYGIINNTFIPDLRHIITVLMNKSIIVEMPFLVKLYVASHIYAIENNFINVDPNDPEISKFDSNNLDFVYNVINPKRFILPDLSSNFLNPRKEFINLLTNLSSLDKQLFIDFYIKTIDDIGFTNKYDLFINDLIQRNWLFDFDNTYSETNLENFDIINDLAEKVVIISKSNYTFANKSEFNIYNDFTENKIKSNIDINFNIKTFNNYLEFNIKRFKNFFDSKIQELKNRNTSGNINENKDTEIPEQLRVETYYSFKNFVDRWFPSLDNSDVTTVDSNRGFLLIENDNDSQVNKFIDLFSFVDRWQNNQDVENIILDISILSDFKNDYNVNMLTVIGRLLNHNGFEFYPLQNFIDYTNVTDDFGKPLRISNEVFKAHPNIKNKKLSAPKFTCMYIGGKSKYLDSGNNKNTIFQNDGFTSDSLPDDASGNNWFGFMVKFGDGKQSLFTQIDLNTEEHQPTNESLSSMALIMDNKDLAAAPISQNLYTVYEQRSYTCKIRMFGNAMIQPTQLFDLRNVPMFNGVYIILKITHDIDGETNAMFTEFEGVRLPREIRRPIINAYEIYGKNLIPELRDLDTTIIRSEIIQTKNKEIKKKDRTIYIIAGHSNNNGDTGALFITSQNIRYNESELTKELRNLIKESLDLKNIKNEIDDDNKTTSQVIEELRSKVKPDDIVLDIHFNSNEGSAGSGTEIFIKDTTNPELINIADNILSQVSDVLNINRRDNGNPLIPSGIKIESQSNIGTLGILSLNTNVMLLEVCFINNVNEMSIYQNNKRVLATKIRDVLSDMIINPKDIELEQVSTFTILNKLRYDNLNKRSNPNILIDKNKIKTDAINTYIKDDYFRFNNKTATIFRNINKSLYMDLVLNQIESSSNIHGIDAMVLAGILYIESQFKPAATSKDTEGNDNAIGIAQFIISTGLLDVLRKLQENLGKTTKAYIYNNQTNNFIFNENLKYSTILSILFNDSKFDTQNVEKLPINFFDYSEKTFRSILKSKNYLNTLINNVYNNPFIMIELAALYLKMIENYSNTNKNKNLGILSISYNMGSVTKKYDSNNENPYFDNLRAKYKDGKEDDKLKILGRVKNEGILYPERLLKEFLVKYGPIKPSDLTDRDNIFHI